MRGIYIRGSFCQNINKLLAYRLSRFIPRLVKPNYKKPNFSLLIICLLIQKQNKGSKKLLISLKYNLQINKTFKL